MCSDATASVLFRPCLHMVACESECCLAVYLKDLMYVDMIVTLVLLCAIGCSTVMKKCLICRSQIEKSIPFVVCCGGKRE